MDILTYLLSFIIIFLLPLGQVFRINLGGGVAVAPLDVGVAITACVSFVFLIRKKKIPFFALPLFLFFFCGFIGLLFAARFLAQEEFFVSLLYLLRFIAYGNIAFGTSFLQEKQKNILLKALLIGGGIIVAAGFVQYAFYQSLWGVLYEGWDPHLYRMFSTFLDPNFVGPFFVLYLLFVLHLLLTEKKKKILFGILSLCTFIALLLTFSRGTYIDAGVSLLVYLFLRGYKKIAMTIPIVVILLGFLFTFFIPYGEGKNLLRTASTDARITDIKNALIIFSKNPIIGVGFDGYRYAQHRYNLLSGFNWEDTHSGAGVADSFVFVLATTGILGGISYFWFWFVILRKTIQNMQQKKKDAIFFLTSFLALLISGLFENTLFYPSIMVWFFILVGLIG